MKELLLVLVKELQLLNCNIRAPIPINIHQHYDIDQVSSLMECSSQTVRTWIREGSIKTFQYKGTIRIRANQLDKFLNKFTG